MASVPVFTLLLVRSQQASVTNADPLNSRMGNSHDREHRPILHNPLHSQFQLTLSYSLAFITAKSFSLLSSSRCRCLCVNETFFQSTPQKKDLIKLHEIKRLSCLCLATISTSWVLSECHRTWKVSMQGKK